MPYKYHSQSYNKENMAKAVGRALPISLKHSVEICNLIRYKTTTKAKELLQKAIDKKQAIPFKRFHKDLGHKKKMGPGRYPTKASEGILNILKAVETNAQFKGLNTTDLFIKHISANGASRPWRFGRQRRRKAKRTNIEIVVEEKIVKKDKTTKKNINKEEPQKEPRKDISGKEKTEAKQEVKEDVKKETKKEVKETKKEQPKPEEKKEIKKAKDSKENKKITKG